MRLAHEVSVHVHIGTLFGRRDVKHLRVGLFQNGNNAFGVKCRKEMGGKNGLGTKANPIYIWVSLHYPFAYLV